MSDWSHLVDTLKYFSFQPARHKRVSSVSLDKTFSTFLPEHVTVLEAARTSVVKLFHINHIELFIVINSNNNDPKTDNIYNIYQT